MRNGGSDQLTFARLATVLVVDDEPAIREIASRWLKDEGFQCLQACDANSAWDCIQTHNVQLASLDVNLPPTSGMTLLSQIRQEAPDVEVIMLIGLSDTRTAIKALTKGAFGYLSKPVTREEFIYQVRKALEHRQKNLAKRRYVNELELQVVEQNSVIRHAHEETIYRLVTAAVCRDDETGAHIRRTGALSATLAQAIGWPAIEVECIRLAAPMHDIGKIAIPDTILRKPGKLTAEEFELMKLHTVRGAEILEGSDSSILQMAQSIALHHHEHWDGSGYPNGRAGMEIPECARILAIVDVFDAISHDRVYRPAFPKNEILSLMQNGCGTHFDPILLKVFMSLLRDLSPLLSGDLQSSNASGDFPTCPQVWTAHSNDAPSYIG